MDRATGGRRVSRGIVRYWAATARASDGGSANRFRCRYGSNNAITASFSPANSSAVSSSNDVTEQGTAIPLGGLVGSVPQPRPHPLGVPGRVRLHQRLLGRPRLRAGPLPGLDQPTLAERAPHPFPRVAPAGRLLDQAELRQGPQVVAGRARRQPGDLRALGGRPALRARAQVLHDRNSGRMGQRPHHLWVADRHPARLGVRLGHDPMIPPARDPGQHPVAPQGGRPRPATQQGAGVDPERKRAVTGQRLAALCHRMLDLTGPDGGNWVEREAGQRVGWLTARRPW